MSGRLIVVKHAMPVLEHAVPPKEWRLSAEGARQAHRWAAEWRRAMPRPALVACSPEPKARATASHIADRLGAGLCILPGLREIDRRALPWMPADTRAAFLRAIFVDRTRAHGGEEPGAWAVRRMAAALSTLAAKAPAGDVLVISHGTAMALTLVAPGLGFPLWRQLEVLNGVAVPRRQWAMRPVRPARQMPVVTSAP